jgi:hypothetical protein
MTRAASLGGVRGPLPSVHAERLATREIITGEFRPCGVQSQIFSPARARCGSRRLIATGHRKVPLLRPVSMIGPAAILAPNCYGCYGDSARAQGLTGWGRRVCLSRKYLLQATVVYPTTAAHGKRGPGGRLTPRHLPPYATCPAPFACCPVRERGRSPCRIGLRSPHPLRPRKTPPPKLGEGSPAVARNERKVRRGRGLPSHSDVRPGLPIRPSDPLIRPILIRRRLPHDRAAPRALRTRHR